MSSLRQRQVPAGAGANEPSTSKPTAQKSKSRNEKNGLSILDIIRVVVTLIVASCGLSYYMTSTESVLWGYRPWFTRWPVLVRYLVCFGITCFP